MLGSGVCLFWWTRLRTWRASARDLAQTPIKLGVVTVAWILLLLGMYALSYRGIRFVYDAAGLGPFLLSRLWFLLLFVILLLLTVSQLPSAYSTLVRAPETRYWMTLPVSARTLCRAKWLESSFYSAWAVVILVLPLYLAYLRVLHKPWWLVGWAGMLLLPLMGIATAVATIGLLVWLRWLGRLMVRREFLPFGFVVACGLLFWVLGEREREAREDVWFLALQAVLPRMRIATSMWLPSSWTATAIDAGLNERWTQGLIYLTLLWTTMLVCWRALDHLAARLLLPVLRRYAQPTEGTGPRRRSVTAVTSGKEWDGVTAPWWMRTPLLASLAKDALLVLRDPMQWSQAVVFFGLLGAYFGNIHRLAQFSGQPSWRIGIASLNLACTLLVFGSLAVRFVFPQMSLEGRSLWLLRIVPHGMRQLLVSKVCLYGVLAICVVDGLLLLSASRLGVPLAIRWWLGGIGVLAAVTIVGLTVGLGACWIDLDAQDAARVVSSSQGALALMCMLGYVGCVIVALIVAWTHWMSPLSAAPLMATLGLLPASFIAGWLPLRLGWAKLEHLERT